MNKKSITATEIFLAILALLLVSVSFYQTWLGLKQIFGNASFIIALVLSLLLLFLCWMIRSAKVAGKPTGGLVWIYIFIASFCFTANFNALYTRFMKEDIYTTELRKMNDKFHNLQTDVEAKLHHSYAPAETQRIRSLEGQLKQQITNEGLPSIGPKARDLIRQINGLLKGGQRITELNAVGDNYKDLADKMGQQIDDILTELPIAEKKIESEISTAVSTWDNRIQAFLLLPQKDIEAQGQAAIDGVLNDYNKLGMNAESVLGSGNYKFVPEVSNTQDVGKIGFAFNHAIKNFGIYQFVVLAGCILLDFVIVIIILIVTTPDGTNSTNSSVFNKRGSKTLTPKN